MRATLWIPARQSRGGAVMQRFTVLTKGGVSVTLVASQKTMAKLIEGLRGTRYVPEKKGERK